MFSGDGRAFIGQIVKSGKGDEDPVADPVDLQRYVARGFDMSVMPCRLAIMNKPGLWHMAKG